MSSVFVKKTEGSSGSYDLNYLILDWSNVVHRAVAVSPEKFVELLITMLLNYRRRFYGWKFCFALDSPGGVEARKVLLPGYKQNRSSRSSDDVARYRTSMELSLELISYVDGFIAKSRQGEADDVVASFIQQSKRGRKFVVVSEDRDLWQLIGPNVTVWTRQHQEINQEVCVERLGALPNRVPMIKALLGDPSDCIPRGVPRVKKAHLIRLAQVLQTPGGVEQALKAADWLSFGDQKRVRDSWPTVLQNYSIIKLRPDLVLEVTPLRPNMHEISRFLSSQKIGIMLQELNLLVAKGAS